MNTPSSTRRTILTVLSSLIILLGLLQPHAAGRAGATGVNRPPQQTGPTDASTGLHDASTQHRTEIPSRRTRTSRTFALSNGLYEAQIAPGSINYLDGSGTWQPIDNSLTPSSRPGYAYQNRANRYTVFFPTDLTQSPIRVETAAGWVTFGVQGVSGAPTVNGATATFALPGAHLVYTAGNDGLKEALVLDGPTSPATLVSTLQMSSGLSAHSAASGGIDIVDGAGTTQLTIPTPSMVDSSHTLAGYSRAVTLTLGQNNTVTLTANPIWLADPARVYPVTIDPSFVFIAQTLGESLDCSLWGSPNDNTNECVYADDAVGYVTSPLHTMLQFNPEQTIPANSIIQNADLALYQHSQNNTSTSVPINAYAVSRTWTRSATWNRYDGTNAWTTAGGDISSTVAASNTVSPTTGWDHWYPTQLVQSWVDGSTPDHGLLLKEPSENVGNVLYFYNKAWSDASVWPTLRIYYQPPVGDRGFSTFAGRDVQVNVANGNLLVHATDLSMAGIGLPAVVDRSYNSLISGGTDMGTGWRMGTGEDVGLLAWNDGSVSFQGPTGYQIPFIRNSDGSYQSPPGIDATLARNSDGTLTLTDHATQEQLVFNNGVLVAQTDRSGNRLSFAYATTSPFSLTSITDTQGRTTNVTTNSNNQITQITDTAGRSAQYGYDANGNLTSTTDAAGKATQYAYDSNHLLTQITTPNGLITKIAYDGSRRVTSITEVTDTSTGTGPTTTFAYTSGNTVVTDSNNHGTTYASDSRGRVTAVTEPDNTVSHTLWTGENRVASFTSPKNETTTYTYDTGNNLTQMQMPGGQSMHWAYATANTVTGSQYLPSSSTDEEGRTTSYGYTPQGLLNSSTDALNHGSSAIYNSNGTLQSGTDENGHTTSYGYVSSGTNVGMPSGITYPTGLGPVSFTYDAANQPATSTDGRGQRTTYSVDALGRTTGMGYTNTNGSSGGSQGYAYDTDGQLLSMAETSGGVTKTTGYTYNLLGQLTQKTLPNGATVSYTYDGESNLLTKTDGGGTTTYTYTANDRPATVKDPNGATTTLTHDANGQQTSVAYPNGVSQNMSYDSGGQLTRIWAVNSGGSTLSSSSYTYTNPSSNRLTTTRYSMTDMNGSVTNYSYDVLNRLTQAIQKNSGGTQTASYGYGYDNVGNMLSKAINGSSTSMAYNAADQLTSAGTSTYSYDPNGNQTGSSGGVSLAYNSQDQTTGMTPTGGSAIGMTYTGAGQAHRTGNGTSSYTYDDTGMGSVVTSAGTTYITNGPNGQLISERVPGKGTYYYLFDGLGSVVGLTDSSGNVVNRYSYDPYGNTTSVTEGVSNSFRYIGAVWDSQTGLYQMGERYYDPKVGRFTQTDPLDGQTYAYSVDSPINFTDPSGLYHGSAFENRSQRHRGRRKGHWSHARTAMIPIPGNPFPATDKGVQDAYKHLDKNHGIKRPLASKRLHAIKRNPSSRLGARSPVSIGRTGDVYDANTGERLGSLTEGGSGGPGYRPSPEP